MEMGRQQRYQKRHKELGLCRLCSRPTFEGGVRCKVHVLRHRLYALQRRAQNESRSD